MSQVTEQSVRFQTALASIKLIQASAVLDLTEDDFDFLTSNKVWIATDRSRARRCVEACVYGTLDFVRSEERFSRNAETDLVCRLLLEKKKEDMCPCGAFEVVMYMMFMSWIGPCTRLQTRGASAGAHLRSLKLP